MVLSALNVNHGVTAKVASCGCGTSVAEVDGPVGNCSFHAVSPAKTSAGYCAEADELLDEALLDEDELLDDEDDANDVLEDEALDEDAPELLLDAAPPLKLLPPPDPPPPQAHRKATPRLRAAADFALATVIFLEAQAQTGVELPVAGPRHRGVL